jgi:hypothetical protein
MANHHAAHSGSGSSATDEQRSGGAAHRSGDAGSRRLFDLSPIGRRASCDTHGHCDGGGGGGAERAVGGREEEGGDELHVEGLQASTLSATSGGSGGSGGHGGGEGSPRFGDISGLQASTLSAGSPGGGGGRAPTAPPPSPPTPEAMEEAAAGHASQRAAIPDAVRRSTPPLRPGCAAAAAARSPGVPPAGFVRAQAGLFGPVCGRAVHNTARLLPSPTAGHRPAPACAVAAAPAPPAIAGAVCGGSPGGRKSVGSGHGRLSSFGAVEAGPRFSLHRGPRYLF